MVTISRAFSSYFLIIFLQSLIGIRDPEARPSPSKLNKVKSIKVEPNNKKSLHISFAVQNLSGALHYAFPMKRTLIYDSIECSHGISINLRD